MNNDDTVKVYTKDELVKNIADFIDSLNDEARSLIEPEQLQTLMSVSEGINQMDSRITNLNQTVADLQKSNEDFRAKIASYAAEKADQMRKSIEPDEDDINPAEKAVEIIKESD